MSNPLRIHITGASGSGTPPLGRALAASLDLRHLDTDDFYWQPSDPPFQRLEGEMSVEERVRRVCEVLDHD